MTSAAILNILFFAMIHSTCRQILRRAVLAGALLALVSPSEAGLFDFWKKSNGGEAVLPDAPSVETQAPVDIFAQQAKNAVNEAAESIGGSAEQLMNATVGTSDRIGDAPPLHKEVGIETKDPGLGGNVEPSDRQAQRPAYDAVPLEKAIPNPDMNEMIGSSEHLETETKEAQLSDNEASEMIANEIENSDEPIGPPVVPALQKELSDPRMNAEVHNALKSQVESALASLSSVYNSLLRTGGHDSASGAISDGVHPVSVRSPVSRSIEENPGQARGELPVSGLQPPAVDHESTTQTPPLAPPDSSAPRNSGSQLPSDERGPGAGAVDPMARPAAGAQETPIVESSKPDGFATAVLSAFAGLVFVAAVGLMIAGFAHSSRDHELEQDSPLYPPRGPNFV